MSHYRSPAIFLALAASLALAGCADDVAAGPSCPATAEAGRIAGTVTVAPQSAPLREGALTLSGTASHASGLAIRRIEVAGKVASNDGFNWDSWSAEVPWESIASLVARDADADPAADDAVVTLEVRATDTCGLQSSLGTVDVEVDPTPGIWVSRLDVLFDLPDGAATLTEGDPRPATLVLLANPAAAGARIHVSTTSGTLRGLTDEAEGTVALSGDGDADATATLLLDAPGVGDVTVTAYARTLVASKAFKVVPAVAVDVLELTVLFPKGQGHLPADGSVPAQVVVSGGPRAAGAEVSLSATSGAFLDSDAPTTTLTLAGAADAETASASALFYGDAAGVVLLTASTADRLASTSVVVAGPPSLLPATGSIAAGQTLGVTVFTDGQVATCQAAPLFGVSVTSGGADLMVTPAAEDDSGDGRVDITVAVDPDVSEGGTLSLSCTDVFGQSATATFEILGF